MPPVARYLAPFAVGVAVGVLLHKYWPQIREAGGPTAKKVVRETTTLFERARGRFWEQSEKFSDIIAEIREEEENRKAAVGTAPEAGPKPPAEA
jgi:hypothetical protein